MKSKIDLLDIPFNWCGHLVPGIWQYFLPEEAQDWRLPKEGESTCSDCPNIHSDDFNKTHRCCTYHPVVPNFLIGLALGKPTPKKAVKKLKKLGYLLPEGFQRTPHQWVDYICDLSEDKFGTSDRIRCPILEKETGLCRIYAYRNGACSTFFCRNDHGARGEKFWVALEDFISQMETALCQWSLDKSGFDVKAYFQRMDELAPKITEVATADSKGWKERVQKFLWAEYWGKEFDLFRQCAKHVSKNREELLEIAEEVQIQEAPKFDNAMNKMVPKEHSHEIDPSDLEDGDFLKPKALWRSARSHYRKLWNFPQTVGLSARTVIKKNPKDDGESIYYKKRPYMLEFLVKKGGTTVDWREYISKKQAKALKVFSRKRKVTPALLKKKELAKLADPEKFLAEWSGKNVLERSL